MSEAATQLIDKIGQGGCHVSDACDLARAMKADGLAIAAVDSMASLGASGKHPQNQERDLFTWLKGSLDLEPYEITLRLKAA